MPYQIIYADPPWSFQTYSDKSGKKVTDHYPVMTDQAIMGLPVADITADNAVLFIWVTFPKLELGLKTIEAWGFKYKTIGFNWVKTNRKSGGIFTGMGYYTRSNTEVCLLATKGKTLPRLSHSVHSVVMAPMTGHSAKPPEVRDRITDLFGPLDRIELFARNTAPGWHKWGNEVASDLPLNPTEWKQHIEQ